MGVCYPVSIGVKSTHKTPIECECEMIHVIWDSGCMDIIAPMVLTEIGVPRIKKIFRLCAESDMIYNTQTLNQWREALEIECEYQKRISSFIQVSYDSACKDFKVMLDRVEAKKFIRNVKKRKTSALKMLNCRKEKLEKLKKILEGVG